MTRAATLVLAAVMLAPAAVASAEPVLDVDVGALAPAADDQYDELVNGGLHVAARPAWLFALGERARGVSIGPTAIVGYTRYGLPDDAGIDGVSRLRVLGGLRVEARHDAIALGAHLAAGLDRPKFDFRELLEEFCGDPSTSGLGLELGAGAVYRAGHARIGGLVGLAKGYHGGDQPKCTGTIVVDVVDYQSTDLFVQATLGFAL